MKAKKLFGFLALGTLVSFSVLIATKRPVLMVKADDGEQTTEVVEQTTTSEISQVAKDCIAVVTNFLSQPLVIGGISTTVGALALLIIGKAISAMRTKKVNICSEQIKELAEKIENCVKDQDFNTLFSMVKNYGEVINEIVENFKNKKVKESCKQMLLEYKPIKDEVVEFAKEEHDKVVEDVKIEGIKVSNEINDILNK